MKEFVNQMDKGDLLQAAKFQVEFYFGQTNYKTDEYLRSFENAEGWIALEFINNFPKMRKYNLNESQIYEVLGLSTIVEVGKGRKFEEEI